MKTTLRRGLTLIELTVVLLILAATAGILVPRLVGYVGRAHGATGASNLQEISKALSLHETNSGAMPNNWDNLIEEGTSTVSASVIEAGATNPFVNTTLTVAEADALTGIGIDTLHFLNVAGTGNATFAASSATTSAVDDTDPIAILTPASVAALGLPLGARVVALGLGSQSTMIGTVMTDAPFHFPEGGETPEEVYLRFCGLFLVNDGTDTLEKANLLGAFVVEPDSGELTGIGDHLGEYFENRDR